MLGDAILMVKSTTLAEEVLVRNIMSSPVIEAREDETIQHVSEKMRRYHVGSVVIVREGKPVGIITKRDLIDKVLAEDLKPSEVSVSEIMSSPVHIISPEEEISNALSTMNSLKVSRLAVVYKDKLAGVVSVKDILQVTPEIFAIIREKMRIEGKVGDSLQKTRATEGYCDSCGEWSDLLMPVDGRYMCEECRLDLADASRREE